MYYKAILDKLYSDYYFRDDFSGVTSSHWKKYGKQAVVEKIENNYNISGIGFGTFSRRCASKYIKNLPELFMNKYLLKKYHVNRELIRAATKIAEKCNRILDFDCIRQILSANLILNHRLIDGKKTVAVIGDGYGFMSSLLKTVFPEIVIISINLGRILFFDAYFTLKVFPQERAMLINKKDDLKYSKEYAFIFLEAEKYNYLFSTPVDFFINISSMQEMDMSIINTYFDIMRSTAIKSYFYCCNRLEKQLPDGSIIKFSDYPWHSEDKIIIDELCPWYQKYPRHHYPFWAPFDGSIWHRLVELKKNTLNSG